MIVCSQLQYSDITLQLMIFVARHDISRPVIANSSQKHIFFIVKECNRSLAVKNLYTADIWPTVSYNKCPTTNLLTIILVLSQQVNAKNDIQNSLRTLQAVSFKPHSFLGSLRKWENIVLCSILQYVVRPSLAPDIPLAAAANARHLTTCFYTQPFCFAAVRDVLELT